MPDLTFTSGAARELAKALGLEGDPTPTLVIEAATTLRRKAEGETAPWKTHRSSKIGSFQARMAKEARWLPLLPGRYAPSSFSVRTGRIETPDDRERRFVWEAELDAQIENGRPRCVAVRRTSGGPALTGTLLRDLSVLVVLTEAMTYLSKEHGRVPAAKLDPLGDRVREPGGEDMVDVLAPTVSLGKTAVSRTRRAYVQLARSRQQGKQPDDTLLNQLAEVYRSEPRRPTEAVAAYFEIPRSTAGRWVTKARDRGFLGPAVGPRPGELGASVRA